MQCWIRETISMHVSWTQAVTLRRLNSPLTRNSFQDQDQESVQSALFIPENLLIEGLRTILVTSGIYFRGLLLLALSSDTPELFVPTSKRAVLTGSLSETLPSTAFHYFIHAVVLWFSIVQNIKCILPSCFFAFGEKCPDSNPLKLSFRVWGDGRGFFFFF